MSSVVNSWNDLRPALQEFALQMEQKLRAKDHKGGWEECPIPWLIERLEEEVGELKEALALGEGVTLEAADVANFAMMVADNNTRLA